MTDTAALATPDPVANPIATERLPLSILKLWRVVVGIETVVLLAVAIAVGIVASLPALLAGLVVGVLGFESLRWWMVTLRYRYWRWGLDDQWIERHSGVVVRRTQLVPRSRVQTLTTRSGPLDRWLGLSSIVVHTAGTATPNLTIPHLDQAAADHLRAELGR